MSQPYSAHIKPKTTDWCKLSTQAQQQGELHWQNLIKHHPSFEQLPTAQQTMIKWQFANSRFIAESCQKEPDTLKQLLDQPANIDDRIPSVTQELTDKLSKITSEDGLKQLIRQVRRQQMLMIAWRDLCGAADLNESFQQISGLAELLISQALGWLYQFYSQQWGTPTDKHGKTQPMYVLGMGKLGGQELNFSSDIDLIFCYPEDGETEGGRKVLDNHTFFTRLGQKLISALSQSTMDGFVYRVDMRLRPNGESGPLVMSYAMLEDYYQSQGRDWERYAMLKARIIAPKQWHAFPEYQALYDLFRPFVYRKYIDFSAIESLRKMKALINQEVKRKGLKDNIKLGAGGIREVEFIAQTFQLIRGGQIPELRLQSTRSALLEIPKHCDLPQEQVDNLLSCYHFLRKTEHVLQELSDAQTQTLPHDIENQNRVANLVGFASYSEFLTALERCQQQVNHVFQSVIADPHDEQQQAVKFDYWLDGLDEETLTAHLSSDHPYIDPELLYKQINQTKQELIKRRVGPRGREVLDKLMPHLIETILNSPKPLMVLQRVSDFIAAIATRTAYLELLLENTCATDQLIKLLSASPWIFEQLCKHPILLDELIDPTQLYHICNKQEYADELRQKLLRVDEDDLEQQMETLRQFKNIQQLRVAAADVTGILPVMKVSDQLTWLAEVILEQVMNLAWQPLVNKHGCPSALEGTDNKGFAILGYGKLGGWEFGYGSDLDMVFVHNQDGYQETTGDSNGKRVVTNIQFYTRYAQKIIHILSARMHSGILYEVDMRLRPSGDSGLLVTSLQGFAEYQEKDAWTWEHQALVRCRPIAGDPELMQQAKQVRHTILATQRDSQKLAQDVIAMRQKMRDHLVKAKEGEFDLKQAQGGIADIEFITQFLVLNNSHQEPDLTEWSDNVRILQTILNKGILIGEQVNTLTDSYLTLRNRGHKLALAQQAVITDASEFRQLAASVTEVWQSVFAEWL
ncbi:bifunctional [glutamate--ammonia ligase]-adenylyl-L-tyrosine phosphorylase/[glutamate--ammonia-ligase] adenylyltransferase [Saccharobesus litoralis]|uniref:Bifunctional glutamine synthetase adenylyltransferase/adenylyl-removing enzyme n=2 Tax=Saccharobesus litoralis TaxID=2172099 RepID=A0A2S0VRE8_9ALTE|nr:bifunctional [glutamate--ammonia ligase]-adenylyl-L-tyrosine phosphorylase/[glutamate--ammonia-ligase] adenylyltransferase [Saccharobesus litoralis]